MGIKGKTIFELTDVNTGETEIIEDNNMVTNGLQEFLNPCGSWGIYPFSVSEVRDYRVRGNFTSGLLLFDNTLDEDVTNTYANADVQMIGNGAIAVSNSGAVTELGSYNVTESGVQEDGSMKYVYDFLTSQANGTIQCACLTSKVGGYMGYGNASTKRVYDEEWKDSYYQPLNYKYFDYMTLNNHFYENCVMYASYEEDAVYIVDPECIVNTVPDANNTIHWTKTGKICIKKRRLGVKSVGLADNNHVNKLIETFDVAIPQEILNYMSSGSGYYVSYVSPVADGHKREIFIIFSKSNQSCSNGSFFWVMKIDKDMQATAYKVTNNTGYIIYNIAYNGDYAYCTFDNDYLWCWIKKDSNYSLVGIKYSDSTQIIETTASTSGNLGITKTFNHLIEYGGTYVNSDISVNKAILNTITNKWFIVNGRTRNASYPGWFKVVFYDKKGLYLTNDNSKYFYLIKDPRYLATINNLSTPVVKTSSKTMKVTYILKDGGDA